MYNIGNKINNNTTTSHRRL